MTKSQSYESSAEPLTSSLFDSLKPKEKMDMIRTMYDMPDSQPLTATSTNILAEIMNNFYGNEKNVEKNRKKWESHIASPDIILADLRELELNDSFFWSPSETFSRLLSIRAGEGRAHSGHGEYKRPIKVRSTKRKKNKIVLVPNPKVNTTIDDIINESEFSREDFGELSENSVHYLLEPIMTYLDNIEKILNFDIDYEKKIQYIRDVTNIFSLLDKDGDPLMGYEFLKDAPIDPLEFMRGYYFASQMDNYQLRKLVTRKYGHEMGGGECYLVNIERLKDFGIKFDELAHDKYKNWMLNKLSHKKRMKLFEELGIVIKSPEINDFSSIDAIFDQGIRLGRVDENTYLFGAYIREKRGAGVSDDTAIVLSSLLPPLHGKPSYLQNPENAWISRFLGAHFADLIDTIDKSMNRLIPGGIDETLGIMLNERFKNIYSRREMTDALGISMPHNSHDLVSQDVLIDYVAASANVLGRTDTPKGFRGKGLHCSGRRFLKKTYDTEDEDEEGPVTCAIREEIAWAQEYHTKNNIPRYEVINEAPGQPLFLVDNITIGFSQIPMNVVKYIFSRSANLLKDPNEREEKIRKYFKDIKKSKRNENGNKTQFFR